MKIKNTIRSYLQRACSIQSLTLLLIWLCMLDLDLQGYRQQATAYGVKDTFAILPFLQGDGYFLKIMLLGVLCFFSNAPFMNRSEMYVILRVGRKRWGERNIGYIFVCSIALSLILAVMSILLILPVTDFSVQWGKLYKTLAVHGNMIGFPILNEMMSLYTPLVLMGVIFVLDALAFAVIGMMLYTLSLYMNRIMTYLLTIIVVFLPTIEHNIKWSIVYFSPFSWINPGKWRYGTMLDQPDFTYMITAYLLMLFLLVIAAQHKISTVEWHEKEE